LKQVCAEGSLSLSSPCLPIYNLTLPRPNIGALSLPVQKARNLFFYSSVISCTISQSHFGWTLSLVYPSTYFAAC
jgi:hypothetical protein